MIDRAEIKFIIAPSDDAMVKVLTHLNKTATEFLKNPTATAIILNHMSHQFSTSLMELASLGGHPIKLDAASVKKFGVKQAATIGGVKIIIMNNFFVSNDQLAKFKIVREKTLFDQLMKQNFTNLIQIGQVKGYDLINLCNTSANINALCNEQDRNGETLFHRLLKADHAIIVGANEDARTIYGRQFNKRVMIQINGQDTKPYKFGDKTVTMKMLKGRYKQVIRGVFIEQIGINYFGLTEAGVLRKVWSVYDFAVAETFKFVKIIPHQWGVAGLTDKGEHVIYMAHNDSTTVFNSNVIDISVRSWIYRGNDGLYYISGSPGIPLSSAHYGYVDGTVNGCCYESIFNTNGDLSHYEIWPERPFKISLIGKAPIDIIHDVVVRYNREGGDIFIFIKDKDGKWYWCHQPSQTAELLIMPKWIQWVSDVPINGLTTAGTNYTTVYLLKQDGTNETWYYAPELLGAIVKFNPGPSFKDPSLAEPVKMMEKDLIIWRYGDSF